MSAALTERHHKSQDSYLLGKKSMLIEKKTIENMVKNLYQFQRKSRNPRNMYHPEISELKF